MLQHKAALVAVALILATVPAVGQNPKSVVGDVQIGYFATTTPAQVRCEGGEPTGTFPPCSEGTKRAFARSEVQLWWPVQFSPSVASLLNGPIVFVVNCNLDAQYRGPCWGTFEWDIPGAGTWEGSWTAPVMDLMTYESKLSMVGNGGGAFVGKQLKLDGGSKPYDWYITLTARIQ